jgi:hypothetical protein
MSRAAVTFPVGFFGCVYSGTLLDKINYISLNDLPFSFKISQ